MTSPPSQPAPSSGHRRSSGAAQRRPARTRTARRRPVENRSLPVYAAGEIDLAVRVFGNDEQLAQDTGWSEHSHPTHELIWHEAGIGSVTAGQRTWTITTTAGLWVPAGTLHSGWAPAGTRQRAAHFDVSTRALAQSPVAVEVSDLLRLLLDRLITAELSESSHAVTAAMILDVLEPARNELHLHSPGSPLLAPIVETLSRDPADAATLEEWARRLGVTGRTITRAFEAETGLSFRRWAATARMQHAVGLLGQGLEIDEVAGRVGFRSASSFSTAFRRITGSTPGRYREIRRG